MQLTLFFLYFDKEHTMHSETNNIRFMSDNVYEATDKLFESNWLINVNESRDFIFNLF